MNCELYYSLHLYHIACEIYHGKAMGDEDDGTVAEMLLQILKQLLFRFDIEGRSGLVEQEHLTWMQYGASYGYALSLSFG